MTLGYHALDPAPNENRKRTTLNPKHLRLNSASLVDTINGCLPAWTEGRPVSPILIDEEKTGTQYAHAILTIDEKPFATAQAVYQPATTRGQPVKTHSTIVLNINRIPSDDHAAALVHGLQRYLASDEWERAPILGNEVKHQFKPISEANILLPDHPRLQRFLEQHRDALQQRNEGLYTIVNDLL